MDLLSYELQVERIICIDTSTLSLISLFVMKSGRNQH